jgi:hypothetical protein
MLMSDDDLKNKFMNNISYKELIIQLHTKYNKEIKFKSDLNIKYEKELNEKELAILKLKIDELKKEFIDLLKKKYHDISDVKINFIILTEITLDNFKATDNFDTYINQLKKLDLYQSNLLSWITKNKSDHRYESREFMRAINQEEIIKDLYGYTGMDLYNFDTLLDSFDEMKPLIILTKTEDVYEYDLVKNFPEYFTFMDSNQPRLLCELMKYYRDPSKVLPVPYVMLPEVQAQTGGKRRTIKKSKHVKRKITKKIYK